MRMTGHSIVVFGALAALATPALGWIEPDTDPVSSARFEREAPLSADGTTVTVTGNALCGKDGVMQVSVSVLQQETLATVRGYSEEVACRAEGLEPFTAELTVGEGRPAFEPGPAMACALSQTRPAPDPRGGRDDPEPAADYDQWCVFIELVGPSA
jgi:hypothetical protein